MVVIVLEKEKKVAKGATMATVVMVTRVAMGDVLMILAVGIKDMMETKTLMLAKRNVSMEETPIKDGT